MLQSLLVQNYALIKDLKIDFHGGFSIITGETGAGKTILLGAFSMLLGSRADSSVLLDKSKKCVVEASFAIASYKLQSFFKQNDIDYSDEVIIRREIDSNRSRAFINDSPVNVSLLKELGDRLIDIHSQHENLYLNHSRFRFEIIDAMAGNAKLLQQYADVFQSYQNLKKQYQELVDRSSKTKADHDYYKFRFDELDQARLKEGELKQVEEESKMLAHAEEIRNNLQSLSVLFAGEEQSVLSKLKEAAALLNIIKDYYPKAQELRERIESAYVDMKDVSIEAESLSEHVNTEPGRLEAVNERLNLLLSLCHKYRVDGDKELIEEKEKLRVLLADITSFDEQIAELEKNISSAKDEAAALAGKLSKARCKASPLFEEQVSAILKNLGMPNALFTVKIEPAADFTLNGTDTLSFLFSANKQVPPADISKVASGGELSRLMLSIKSLVASSLALPSIIFDEIDAGVSGEIADKMGNIMKGMAGNMQVISITHLPQVASKGGHHYLVYKTDTAKSTSTYIKLLSSEERIVEIAKMLSGEKLTDSAMDHARILLKNN